MVDLEQTVNSNPNQRLPLIPLPSFLSTGWFQERVRAWFHNRTKIHWLSYGRM